MWGGGAAILAESRDFLSELEAGGSSELTPPQRRALRDVQHNVRALVLDGRLDDLELVLEAMDVLRRSLVLDLAGGPAPTGRTPFVRRAPARVLPVSPHVAAQATDGRLAALSSLPGAGSGLRDAPGESADASGPVRRTAGGPARGEDRSKGLSELRAAMNELELSSHGRLDGAGTERARSAVDRLLVSLRTSPALSDADAAEAAGLAQRALAIQLRALPLTAVPADGSGPPGRIDPGSLSAPPPAVGVLSAPSPVSVPTVRPTVAVPLGPGAPVVIPVPPEPPPAAEPVDVIQSFSESRARQPSPVDFGTAEAESTTDTSQGQAVRPSMRVSALAGLRAVGVVLVLFVVFALYGSAILQGRAQRALSAASHFRLTSPNVGLDELVLGNDSRSALAKGPGLANSAMRPGAAAPLVIVGHRTTNGGPFRHIAALHPGDTVTIRVPEGSVYTYVVQRLLVTAPGTKVQGTPGTQLLYLVSANPPYRGSGRLVVVARLTSGGSLLPVGPQTEKLPDLGGSTLALLIAIGILALIGVYWTARVFWRSRLPSWVRWASWLPAVALAYLSWQLLLGSMSRVL